MNATMYIIYIGIFDIIVSGYSQIIGIYNILWLCIRKGVHTPGVRGGVSNFRIIVFQSYSSERNSSTKQ